MTSVSACHLSHYISTASELKELVLWGVKESGRYRSAIPLLLPHFQSHPLPSLHCLTVGCDDDGDVRALTAFLPQCTNLRMLCFEREQHSFSESVDEEMWEAAVRRCRNLEVVKMSGACSGVSCVKLKSVLEKLSENEGRHALNLRMIVRVDLDTGEVVKDYTEQVKHLLPALE